MEFIDNRFKEIAVSIIVLICVLSLIFQDRKQKKKLNI